MLKISLSVFNFLGFSVWSFTVLDKIQRIQNFEKQSVGFFFKFPRFFFAKFYCT